MKLIVLHGNGQVALSKRLSLIKSEFDELEISLFDGRQIDFAQALIEILTPQLFSEKRLVIFENFDEKIDLEKLGQDDSLTLVFRFNKGLSANSKFLSQAKALKAEIILQNESDEVSIFPFLDRIVQKDKSALRDLDKLIDERGGQYLITMFGFMLRRLIVIPSNLPTFILTKAKSNQKNFSQAKVKELYLKLIETDFKIKSGLIEEKMGIMLFLNAILD